jgi:hypothetical protein
MFAPRFAQPMYAALRDLSQDLLLPGLEAVGPDCVLGLRTNRRFVDAYMVGLNFEMGRELLWRGFPTDQRGTYFAQFWDTAGGAARSDIDAIHLWGARMLGAPRGTPEAQFVMLLRSALLRRYPTAAIYAVPAIEAGSGRSPSLDAEAEVHPAFRGTLPPDVTFIGFDLTVAQVLGGPGIGAGFYIVIQEQPTEPQFGLDAGAAPAGAGHLEAAPGPPDGLALRGLQWGRNGAHMAGITRRTPVRVAIHASRFVPPPEPPA